MLTPGELIDGKYRVERLLGQGGMGAVFEGYHTLVDRRVAIKVLLPKATSSGEGAARFEREVRATGRIGNDHILEVYDVGVLPDGSRYMVSEYLDGETLADRLGKTGSLPAPVVGELTLQLLDGLEAAHAAGIVHRDLKPENVFLLRKKAGRSDFLKIIDFGISKFQLDESSSMSMTATGTVLGTPYYLSPEQARGQRDIDARSDLYTVGVIMYQAVCGRVPVQADSFNELLFKIALEAPPPLAKILPGIDEEFSKLVERAMAKKREGRFQTATEMRTELADWCARHPVGSQSALVPAGLAAGFDATATVTGSMPLPTTVNFGRTASPDGFASSRGTRLKIALGAGALLLVAGVAAAVVIAGRGADSNGAAASQSIAAPVVPSAAPPPAVVIAPAEPARPLPAEEATPEVRLSPESGSAVSESFAPAAPVARPTTTSKPRPVATAPSRPAGEVRAAPAPSGKRRRDFGY